MAKKPAQRRLTLRSAYPSHSFLNSRLAACESITDHISFVQTLPA
ncbi:hypothetical protein BN137_1267 [Cronobacter condimenti 1330]|uniref:Uncharacterized protein n=1 Tax=Cronobacter condimenti 1330 TaxID=1073999 RepID=K8A845_9ENTR|nr:hypothetical protein BN137_1267 [Cronobacter condimenti 1330]